MRKNQSEPRQPSLSVITGGVYLYIMMLLQMIVGHQAGQAGQAHSAVIIYPDQLLNNNFRVVFTPSQFGAVTE